MFVLTIVMVLNGKPLEQSYHMGSLSQCWEMAQARLQELQAEHPGATKIGAGCIIDKGAPI